MPLVKVNEGKIPHFSLANLFSREEVDVMERIWITLNHEHRIHDVHKELLAKVVTPEAMERIDRITGQKNDKDYIAYAIEYALSR